MRFTVDRKALLRELKILVSVAERKTSLRVLKCIRFDAYSGLLKLTATDLDHCLMTEIPVSAEAAGSTLVDARLLHQVVIAAESETLEFMTVPHGKDPRLGVTAGKARWELATQHVDDYPETPVTPKRFPLKTGFEVFRSAMASVQFVATVTHSKYTLHGCKFAVNGSMKMVAASGHRLAIATIPGVKGDLEALVGLKTMKIVQGLPAVKNILICTNDTWVWFQAGRCLLAARKLTGSFPGYENLLPNADFKLKASFDAVAMTHALRQAFTTVDRRSLQVIWTFRADGITEIASTDEELGVFKTEIVTNYKGEEIKIWINLKYILEMCQRQTGIINMRLKSPLDRLIFSVGDDYQYIVMPLRQL